MSNAALLTIPHKFDRDIGPFADEDNRFPDSLVRHFVKNHTKRGDVVFDPFAGFGTTLFTAEAMKRCAYGMEADPRRHEWAAGQLENWTGLVCDDAAAMGDYAFPKIDFAITSPPYMPNHHKWNPLYGGDPKYAGYDTYLKRMGHIFGQLRRLMKRNALCVVQLDNIKVKGRPYTPLVWDIGNAISKHMRLEEEIIVCWENPPKDYPYTRCLIFKNT